MNHWLDVLSQYFRRLAEFNSDPAHGFRAEGEVLELNIMMGKESTSIHKLPVHANMMLKDVLAKAVQLATELGANLDVSALPVATLDDDYLEGGAAGGVAAEASAGGGIGKKQALRPVRYGKTNQPMFGESLKGANQTLSELGVKPPTCLSLQAVDDVFAGGGGGAPR